MMTDIVTALVRIETPQPDKLRSMFDHHVDWLIDIEGNADVISSVQHVATCDSSVTGRDTLRLLKDLLGDILSSPGKGAYMIDVYAKTQEFLDFLNKAAPDEREV